MHTSITNEYPRARLERTSRVTQKGQVTIPQEIRAHLGLKPHDTILFQLDGATIRLQAAPSRLLGAYGTVSPMRQPEDFKTLRQQFEHGVAQEVSSKG